jgi:hypothetical protein
MSSLGRACDTRPIKYHPATVSTELAIILIVEAAVPANQSAWGRPSMSPRPDDGFIWFGVVLAALIVVLASVNIWL